MDFLPLQSEHGEVVALLSVACEVGHSLRHPSDERTGLGQGCGRICTSSGNR